MRLRTINSIHELKDESQRWNALWQSCDLHSPTLRFELLELFVAQFHSNDPFFALVVEDESETGETVWIAALPLVIKSVSLGQSIGMLPNNPWMVCGELLVDNSVDLDDTIQLIVKGARALPCTILKLDWIDIQRNCWEVFQRRLGASRVAFDTNKKFTVGTVRLTTTSDEFRSGLSKNRRKQIKRSFKKLDELGLVTLKHITSDCRDRFEANLKIALEIEAASWKGEANSTILACDLEEFFCATSSQLIDVNAAELWLLFAGDRPIAFDLGCRCKQVYTSHKVSFDDKFRKHGPGSLLDYLVIEAMSDDPRYEWIDTFGVLTEANAKWANGSYERGQICLPTSKFGSKLAYTLLKMARQFKRRLRRNCNESSSDLPTSQISKRQSKLATG